MTEQSARERLAGALDQLDAVVRELEAQDPDDPANGALVERVTDLSARISELLPPAMRERREGR